MSEPIPPGGCQCDGTPTFWCEIRKLWMGRATYAACKRGIQPYHRSNGTVRRAIARQHKTPGLARKAANFSAALADHVAHGMPHVTAAEKERRLAICRTCSYYDADRDICSNCGCTLGIKAAWKRQHCPAGLW